MKPKLVGGAVAAALAIATPFIAGWEGKNNSPHFDKIGNVWDVCYGDTQAPLRYHTDAECLARLKTRTGGYMGDVLKCTPRLQGHQLAAATSLAYNIGSAAYCRSTAARRFNAGNLKGGCDAFLSWRFAGGREIPGLLNRRKAERNLCLKGLS